MPAYIALPGGPPRKAGWYYTQGTNAGNADKFHWFHRWRTFFAIFAPSRPTISFSTAWLAIKLLFLFVYFLLPPNLTRRLPARAGGLRRGVGGMAPNQGGAVAMP
jgi:hypothetical protein